MDTLTFAELKAHAIFYENIINAAVSGKKKKQTAKCTYKPCGSTEHNFEDCPLRLSKQCTLCMKFGHLAGECRSQSQDAKTRDLSHIQCRKCNQMGHYANTCTANSAEAIPTVKDAVRTIRCMKPLSDGGVENAPPRDISGLC